MRYDNLCETHRLLASGANLCPSPLGPRRAAHLLGSSSGFDAVDAVDAAAVGGDDAAGSVGLRQGAPRGDVGGGLVVDEVLLGLKIRTSSCAWKYSDFFCIKCMDTGRAKREIPHRCPYSAAIHSMAIYITYTY